MSEIVFTPWVGTSYQRAEPRLLILGESHYGEPHPEPAQSTITVVEKWREGEWKVRYLLAAARLLSGLPRWEVTPETALANVAFYNFVQFMMPWHDTRPTPEQFVASTEAFREVLTKLDPTHIIATGKTLWWGMPHFDVEGVTGQFLQFGCETMEVGRYRTPSGFALVTLIPHLSRYFSPPRWHDPIKQFLALRG